MAGPGGGGGPHGVDAQLAAERGGEFQVHVGGGHVVLLSVPGERTGVRVRGVSAQVVGAGTTSPRVLTADLGRAARGGAA
ncbi:hypothetical protein GCM10009802_15250 [Streptomyces synnematoformans]|uniref:Uncharacterized protein n=1 Tax=Streptomyces synnematoformans TaxID=415721 RepID=A0ABP5JB53_9ACTN